MLQMKSKIAKGKIYHSNRDTPKMVRLEPSHQGDSNEGSQHTFFKKNILIYSRLLFYRLRLSRITAYLEEKIWSLFNHRNLASGNKILWIRGEIAPQEQFLPFSTIFSIYIFLTKGV